MSLCARHWEYDEKEETSPDLREFIVEGVLEGAGRGS